MTREEAEKEIRDTFTEVWADGIIKALEQEPILDKIREEIIDTGAYEQEVHGKTQFLEGINYCLGVIDKYRAESEGEYACSD